MPDKKNGQKPNQSSDQQSDKAVKDLINALNEDLAREYQAIIAYTVYSNVISGAKWMNIAGELKKHENTRCELSSVVWGLVQARIRTGGLFSSLDSSGPIARPFN